MRTETLASTAPADFRLYLQRELIRRCEKNESYSLRAFAAAIGMSHATLSSILSGKRPLTQKAIIKIGKALNLPEKELKQFIHKKTQTKRDTIAQNHHILALDAFTAIADWYHDAILELTHTKNFKPDHKWIAKRLGISNVEVQAAKERLIRLELLEIKGDKWIDLSRNNTTNLSNDLSSSSLRKLQQKILEMSAQALVNLPRTERDHTSLTVAMDKADLPEVKERIKQFRYELVAFIERKQAKPDEVYQFAFSAFPITQTQPSMEN